MAQKFLSVKNFEKYQHYKHRNPPWIRLYGSLFQDPDFIRLPIKSRYLYVGLLPLCARYENRVPLDCNWIAHMLAMDAKEIDLTPLYRSGFLLASRKHVASMLHENAPSDSDNSDSSETDSSDAVRTSAPPPTQPPVLTKKRAGIPTTFPETFAFTREMKEWALEEGCQEPFAEFEHFRDKAKAEGKMYIDWSAAFRTWIHNHVKWKREKVNAKVLQNVR